MVKYQYQKGMEEEGSVARYAKLQQISGSSRRRSDKESSVSMCVASRRLTETLLCTRGCLFVFQLESPTEYMGFFLVFTANSFLYSFEKECK